VFSQAAFFLQFFEYLYHSSRRTPIVERCFRPEDNASEEFAIVVVDMNVARRVIAFPPDKKITAAANLSHGALSYVSRRAVTCNQKRTKNREGVTAAGAD